VAERLLPEPPFDGLRFRTYRGEDDLPAIVEVMRASLQANGEVEGVSVEEMAGRHGLYGRHGFVADRIGREWLRLLTAGGSHTKGSSV
jgi:hypothetical protein